MNVETGVKEPMIRVAPTGMEKPFIHCRPAEALLPTTDYNCTKSDFHRILE
jgi:hypothetical protein